jgi:hypothetical protein
MQTYGLSSEQVDWAMNGSRNLPNIINIMNDQVKVSLGININNVFS